MIMIMIDVSEFSKTPFGRYYGDGEYSAQCFREQVLEPKLKSFKGSHIQKECIKIDFTKVSLGVGSSFLEEAFGGLVRKGFDKESLLECIQIIDRMGFYDTQVKRFIKAAKVNRVKG